MAELVSMSLRRKVDDFLMSIEPDLPRGLRVVLMVDTDWESDGPATAQAIWRLPPLTPETDTSKVGE